MTTTAPAKQSPIKNDPLPLPGASLRARKDGLFLEEFVPMFGNRPMTPR